MCAHKNSRLTATDRTPRLLPLLQKGLRLLLQSFDVLLAAVVWVRRGVVWVIARVPAVVIDEAVLVFVFVFVVSGGVFLSGTSGGGCRQQTVLTGLHAETLQTSPALQEVTHQNHFTWRHCVLMFRGLVSCERKHSCRCLFKIWTFMQMSALLIMRLICIYTRKNKRITFKNTFMHHFLTARRNVQNKIFFFHWKHNCNHEFMIFNGVCMIMSVIQMFELLVYLVHKFIWIFSAEGSCVFSESEDDLLARREKKQHSKQS